jgi:START domain
MTNSSSTTTTVHDGLNHDDPGLAHIQRPYQLSLEEEVSLLEQARQRRTQLLEHDVQSDDWYSRVTYHGVTVTSKKEADNPFCITKGLTEAPEGMTLHNVCQQFECDFSSADYVLKTMHRIDPMTRHMTTIAECQHCRDQLEEFENLRVIWGVLYVAPLVSDRDFVFAMHTSISTCPVTNQPVFCSNSFSIELPAAVPDLQSTTGYVRSAIQKTGYIFRPLPDSPNRLSMAFVGQCDPKGYLPAAIVNLASVSQALNAGRVRDNYIHFWNVALNELKLDAYVPISCYQVPRRGGGAIHAVSLPTTETTTFSIRLRAHCDHPIAMELAAEKDEDKALYKLELADAAAKQDDVAVALLQGKSISFGGKTNAVLDVTLQVTLMPQEGEELKPCLQLVFHNSGWKKATLCLPLTMEVLEASSAVEQ